MLAFHVNSANTKSISIINKRFTLKWHRQLGIPIETTSSARSISMSHSFWKRFVSLISESTRSTVSPISVISDTIFRCESKLICKMIKLFCYFVILLLNWTNVGQWFTKKKKNNKKTCNSRKSCSNRLRSKHCFNRMRCVCQKSSNRRSVSSNCTKSLR